MALVSLKMYRPISNRGCGETKDSGRQESGRGRKPAAVWSNVGGARQILVLARVLARALTLTLTLSLSLSL